MELESCMPPGFRFHPTEEELVGYYLKRKVNSEKNDLNVIADVDLYRIEPWDIQDRCKLGYEEQNEWYFFSHKDKKYPTGTRTNRATAAGFWKATGRDKAVLAKHRIIGMRKTLVFYKGRAPNGKKTDWIMHEYRLQTTENGPPEDEGWVVCRAFKKPSPSHRQGFEAWNRAYYVRELDYLRHQAMSSDNSSSIMQPSDQHPYQGFNYPHHHHHQQPSFANNFEQELSSKDANNLDNQLITELPQLDSPSVTTGNLVTTHGFEPNATMSDNYTDDHPGNHYDGGQIVDWKIMDKLLSSQFINETAASASSPISSLPLIPQADYSTADAHNNQSNCLLDWFS